MYTDHPPDHFHSKPLFEEQRYIGLRDLSLYITLHFRSLNLSRRFVCLHFYLNFNIHKCVSANYKRDHRDKCIPTSLERGGNRNYNNNSSRISRSVNRTRRLYYCVYSLAFSSWALRVLGTTSHNNASNEIPPHRLHPR